MPVGMNTSYTCAQFSTTNGSRMHEGILDTHLRIIPQEAFFLEWVSSNQITQQQQQQHLVFGTRSKSLRRIGMD